MKIAIISDSHLGYARFEEDAYVQFEKAILLASEKADIILFAGDVFDTKVPKLETLEKAVQIFRKARVPVVAIHGNHERRSKDSVNPVQLLAAAGVLEYLHGRDYVFEKEGEKLQVLGMGSVPEEYAATALKKVLEGFSPAEGAFRVLMIHQSIKGVVPGGDDELSLDDLEGLDFDLIADGHIHNTMELMEGKLLLPGSTVVTQLKKDETESKGLYLVDTKTGKAVYEEIKSRPFFYEELVFENAGLEDIRKRIQEKVGSIKKDKPDAIIAVKLKGTLKEGIRSADVETGAYENTYIDNMLNSEELKTKLERIREMKEEKLSVRETAVKELVKKTEGKIKSFDCTLFFDKLLQGVEEADEYLQEVSKKMESSGGGNVGTTEEKS